MTVNEEEDKAIPLCGTNRAETGSPYCVSAYCPRCARQRELDDVPPVVPNAWLTPVPGAHEHYFRYDPNRAAWYCVAEDCGEER
jgi:hypothetical protein